jgi:hypothetical protein
VRKKEFLQEKDLQAITREANTNPFSYLTMLSHNLLKPSTMSEEEYDAYLYLVEFGITRNTFADEDE